MLTGLTNLLFGTKKAEHNDPDNNQGSNQTAKDLKTKEDGGWIVVSKGAKKDDEYEFSDESSDAEDVECNSFVLDITNEMDRGCSPKPNPAPPIFTPPPSTPSTPSSLAHLDPEGSWYLTPPPCFTAGNSKTVVSPMENLLIEHPSMSVYQWTDDGDCSMAVSQELTLVEVSPEQQKEAGTSSKLGQRQVPHHGSRSVVTRAGLIVTELFQKGLAPNSSRQKKLERRKTKSLQRSQLDRCNKAREFEATCKNRRRKDYMKNPSGANNNRRC